jgi:hypothetical protein
LARRGSFAELQALTQFVNTSTFETLPRDGAVAAVSADMRGNSDESWSRPLDWLIRNRLLAPGYRARQKPSPRERAGAQKGLSSPSVSSLDWLRQKAA